MDYNNLTDAQKKVVDELANYSGKSGVRLYGNMEAVKSLIDCGWVLVNKHKKPRKRYSDFYYRLSSIGRAAIST